MNHNIIILDNGGYNIKIGLIRLNSSNEILCNVKKLSYNKIFKELSINNISKGPIFLPNCIIKAKSEIRRPVFIGDQIDDINDKSSLYFQYPFQKGYLVGWDIQKQIWDRIFKIILPEKLGYTLPLSDTELIITTPPLNFAFTKQSMYEIFFEEYGFASVLQISSLTLSASRFLNFTNLNQDFKTPITFDGNQSGCYVIDSGFSFTHLAYYKRQQRNNETNEAKLVGESLRRLDVGGKLLTNYLKDIISYRQLHVLEETYVINLVKEDACYVSPNFMEDITNCAKLGNTSSNPIFCEYVLPDFHRLKRGYIKTPLKNLKITEKNGANHNPSEFGSSQSVAKVTTNSNTDEDDTQTLYLNNERISVPEILFHPSDIGLMQMGVPELLFDSLNAIQNEFSRPNPISPKKAPDLMVVLTGGNTKFPGFDKRLLAELRALADDSYNVCLFMPENPELYAYEAAVLLPLLAPNYYNSQKLTKKQFQESHKSGGQILVSNSISERASSLRSTANNNPAYY